MADKDKDAREEAPQPDPAAQVRTVSVSGAPASAPAADAPVAAPSLQPSRFTPEETGPGAPFDPTVRYRVAPVSGPPEAKQNTKKVWVQYRGPSDNFHVEEHRLNRLDPVQMAESTLDWLRANQRDHFFEEIPAPD